MFGYVLDDVFLQHRAPAGHPERPARAEAVRDALLGAGVQGLGVHVPVRAARDEELARVHGGAYLDDLTRLVPGQEGWLDPDTYFSAGTWAAALGAVGSVCSLADAVMSGRLLRGLAVVRPPGHHATRDQGMGFCLLNNVAAAAAAARAAGAARVAIVDWDVHHGNGTQDIFWNDPNVMYVSVHQYPYYPGTGAPGDIGGPEARGATVNVGLPAGSTDADYAAAFDHVILPAIERFAPDIVFISAGFDAFQDDPLAGMHVTLPGFRAMAARLRFAADRWAGGRLVAVMEGGYDLHGVAGGMTEVLGALTMAEAAYRPEQALPLPASGPVRDAIQATIAALSREAAA